MITKKSNHDIKPRKTIKVSDLSIFFSLVHSPCFKDFFKKSRIENFTRALKQFLQFDNAARAFQFWMVFRYKAGKKTFGIVLLIYCLCTGIAYNSIHVPYCLKPFAGFIVPFIPFFKSWDEIYKLTFIDIESRLLLLYLWVLTVLTCIRLVKTWNGKSNLSDTKRGESILFTLISRFVKVSDFFVCIVIETILGVGIGLAVWHYLDDPYFGVYMIYITLSEMFQGVLDKAYQSHIESVLKA